MECDVCSRAYTGRDPDPDEFLPEVTHGLAMLERFNIPAVCERHNGYREPYIEDHFFRFGDMCSILMQKRGPQKYTFVSSSFYVIGCKTLNQTGVCIPDGAPRIVGTKVYILIAGGDAYGKKDTILVQPKQCFRYSCMVQSIISTLTGEETQELAIRHRMRRRTRGGRERILVTGPAHLYEIRSAPNPQAEIGENDVDNDDDDDEDEEDREDGQVEEVMEDRIPANEDSSDAEYEDVNLRGMVQDGDQGIRINREPLHNNRQIAPPNFLSGRVRNQLLFMREIEAACDDIFAIQCCVNHTRDLSFNEANRKRSAIVSQLTQLATRMHLFTCKEAYYLYNEITRKCATDEFTCALCPARKKSFPNIRQIHTHFRLEHDLFRKVAKCKVASCHNRTKQNQHYMRHARTRHQNANPAPVEVYMHDLSSSEMQLLANIHPKIMIQRGACALFSSQRFGFRDVGGDSIILQPNGLPEGNFLEKTFVIGDRKQTLCTDFGFKPANPDNEGDGNDDGDDRGGDGGDRCGDGGDRGGDDRGDEDPRGGGVPGGQPGRGAGRGQEGRKLEEIFQHEAGGGRKR